MHYVLLDILFENPLIIMQRELRILLESAASRHVGQITPEWLTAGVGSNFPVYLNSAIKLLLILKKSFKNMLLPAWLPKQLV